MKNKTYLVIALMLALASLACGSSGVEVNEPSEEQIDAAMAELQGEDSEEQAEPTAQVGTARSNPAPAGSEVVADDMAFVVTGFTRPATDVIMAGNPFNTEPETGQEYIMVNLQVTCQKSTDEQCNISSFNFKMLGSAGVSRDAEAFVAGVDGLMSFDSDFYGGATIEGGLPFIIGAEETDLLLVYEPFLGDNFYLALE